jgi:hypothetical protein
VLWLLLQVLETSPYSGGAVEIYIWHYYDHLFQVPGAFLCQGSVAAAALVFTSKVRKISFSLHMTL